MDFKIKINWKLSSFESSIKNFLKKSKLVFKEKAAGGPTVKALTHLERLNRTTVNDDDENATCHTFNPAPLSSCWSRHIVLFVVSSSTAEQPNKVSEMKVIHANQTLAAAGSVTDLNCSSQLHLKEQFNSFLRVPGLSTQL